MTLKAVRPVFVEFVPKELEEGVLYISEKYKIAVHRCASGCGEKVVTPLSPADWQVRKKGDLISMYPSIGNWNFVCRSHYWIRDNRIVWAPSMSDAEIVRVQLRDRADKARQIDRTNAAKEAQRVVDEAESLEPLTWWRRFLGRFG